MTDHRHVLRGTAWLAAVALVVFVAAPFHVLATSPSTSGSEPTKEPVASPHERPAADPSADDSEDHVSWWMTNHVPRLEDPPRLDTPGGSGEPARPHAGRLAGKEDHETVLVGRIIELLELLVSDDTNASQRPLAEEELQRLLEELGGDSSESLPTSPRTEDLPTRFFVPDNLILHLDPPDHGTLSSNPFPVGSDEWYLYIAEHSLDPVKAERDALRSWQDLMGGPAFGWRGEHSEVLQRVRRIMERARIEMRRPW